MTNALVPVMPKVDGSAAAQSDQPTHTDRAKAERAKADFVAHLIATAVQAPQTRARRRTEPEHAVAAYRSSLGQRPTEPGRALSRSL